MNTAMRWEPFHRFDEFFNNLSPLFGRLPSVAAASNEPDLGWMPVTDILEGEKEYVVKLDLPEVPREAPLPLEEVSTPEYLRRKIVYRADRYSLIPAYLFIPRNLDGPAPAVLVQQFDLAGLEPFGAGDRLQSG